MSVEKAQNVGPFIESETTMKNIQIIETVTFRAITGTDPQTIAAASDGMTPFLARQKGFVSRRLSLGEDGVWLDHVHWVDMDSAQAAAQAVMTAPEAGPFMSLIDMESVTMRHDALMSAQAA
jgi:hypothetical protein